MISNVFIYLNHFKSFDELFDFIHHDDVRCRGGESDNMSMINYNLCSMPLLRKLGIKSMTEVKNAAIASGSTVMIDHDFFYSELYDEGKLLDVQSMNEDNKILIYSFSEKVNSLAEALNRYQRRFMDAELEEEYFKYMIEFDENEKSYEDIASNAVNKAIKINSAKGANSYLLIENNGTGLHLSVVDNNEKIIVQDSFLISDLADFEKEYENIEF